ncbi:MAG: MFS transporter [Oscillospiraceae bacterium]|jgi:Na+/melibiose symporter-like transporter|nr:MFS transporter [Oscillospiraceae bacterium]
MAGAVSEKTAKGVPGLDRMDGGRTVKISLAFAWISIFNGVLDSGLPLILSEELAKGGLGLGDLQRGAVMALDNVLGLFLLPLFGMLSDRSRSKYGRRTPFILAGGIGAALSWLAAGFFLSGGQRLAFLLALTAGLACIAISRPAALSLLPDFTRLEHRRSANAATQIISILATGISIGIVTVMTPRGFPKIFFATAAAMALLIALFVATVKERRWLAQDSADTAADETTAEEPAPAPPSSRRNRIFLLLGVFFFYIAYNGLVSSLAPYATQVMGLHEKNFTIPQILCFLAAACAAIPVSKLAAHFNRRILLALGLLVMLFAFLLANTQKGLTPLMFVSFVLVGLGYSVAIVNFYPFMLELSDPRQIGKNTGIYNNAMMLAMIITPVLSGALFEWLSIRILFPYCMAALALGTASVMLIRDQRKAVHKKPREE